MRRRREAARDRYDAVVIGSGLGGLACAALLARAGQRVLVAERHDRPGGCAHAFRRHDYLFDSAVHLVGGCAPTATSPGGLPYQLLRTVGAAEALEFEAIDPIYSAAFPGLELRPRSGIEEFVRSHVEAFPAERKGLHSLVHECLALQTEVRSADEFAAPLEVMRHPRRFPTLLRYRRATLAQVMDEHLRDPRAKAAFAAFWPYLGLPPGRVSFLYFATMLLSYVAEGSFYCRGGFQRVAEALGDVVERAGGELLLRAPVARIELEDGRAAGVVLESGQRVGAPVVVSNADLRHTASELLRPEDVPSALRERLPQLRPSISAFVVYVATGLDLRALGATHETFVYADFDHDAAYQRTLAGCADWWSATVPTLADPTLAPPGEHVVTLTTLAPWASPAEWRARKPAFVERALGLAERRMPGLRDALLFVEGGSPSTLFDYTRNAEGAIYGWALSPDQIGRGRPANATGIPGFWLAGHWAQPGGGVYGVLSSGVNAARAILGPEYAGLFARFGS
jgi:prolycopene isomerase